MERTPNDCRKEVEDLSHYEQKVIKMDSYLTIAPSGLEEIVFSAIRDALSISSYQVQDLALLSKTLSSDEVQKLKSKLFLQQKRKLERKQKWTKAEKPSSETSKGQRNDFKEKKTGGDQNVEGNLFQRVVGSVKLDGQEHEVNMGYRDGKDVLSSPGGLEGKSLILFRTNAPPNVVANIRAMGCGPLLAFVATSCQSSIKQSETIEVDINKKDGKVFQYNEKIEDAIKSLSEFLQTYGRDKYFTSFDKALSLWSRHAKDVWCKSKDILEFQKNSIMNKKRSHDKMDDCLSKDQYRYRVSCIRAHNKLYKYSREEFTLGLVEQCMPQEESNDSDNHPSTVDTKKEKTFVVNLKSFDFELVVLIHDNNFTIGIDLRPYQHLGAKCFANGKIPPDITSPYITGTVSQTVVRLRPSIAALLCNLAEIENGDVILDPCAGVGTIPVEASFQNKKCFALGGDLAISASSGGGGGGSGLNDVVADYTSRSRHLQNVLSRSGGTSDMLSWDAGLLPVRDASVDCIVSDLPFGVLCLSSSKLATFLPLLFSECARVLRRKTGRMVLLCGSPQGVLDALDQQSKDTVLFETPVTAVFPVNIGGLAAWVIQVQRGEGEHKPIKNHRDRVKKIASTRREKKSTKKRIQS